MNYTDLLISDFTHAAFQRAFRAYFGELGVNVNNWDGLFAEMNAGEDRAFVRLNEAGEAIAFIQFTTMDMSSWFFTAKCGFIREFWVREDIRRQGHGTQLLQKAEEWLREQGCRCALLTTDTAPDFYRKHGYRLETGIEARNRDNVYLKRL